MQYYCIATQVCIYCGPMSKRIIILITVIVVTGGVLMGGATLMRSELSPAPIPVSALPISVRTTVFPYAEIARAVMGSDADIKTITPVGIEPHDFEPTPRDIAELTDANIVIYNGANLEPWIEEVVRERQKTANKTTINVSDIALVKIANDPHLWLNIDNLMALTLTLATETPTTQEAIPALINKLTALDATYRTTLAHCRRNDAIVGHHAFDYIAQRYGINLIPIRDINPEQEPSPQRIATIIDIMRQKNIRYILTEPLTQVKEIDTIRSALGAAQITLDPMEAMTHPDRTLFDIWNQNLTTLTTALDCAPQK